MKKSLFVLGVAVAALASCTNEEVMDVAQNRAIGFSSFVNNNTRAVTEVGNSASTGVEQLTSFYVFGNYGVDQTTGPWTGEAFNNELQTAEYYWQVGNHYRFGAYANGNGGKIESANVAFDASQQQLSFTGYTPDDAKDLVAAFGTGDASASAPQDAVSLTFSHMLSQVGLTFTTDAAATYELTISNVQIADAISTSNATVIASQSPVWASSGEGVVSNGYTYADFADGLVISSEAPASQTKLVIPQNNTNSLSVSFTATIAGEAPYGSTILTKNFTASLAHNITDSGLSANTWTNGYRYNYTAKVEIKDIVDNPDDLVQITFEPSVTEWQNASDEDITTNPQPAS